MRFRLSSTSTRTFVVVPVAVAVEQALSRRRPHLRWAPLLGWGYLQYKYVGGWRIQRAGGPAGMSQGYPEHLVTKGIYAHTRNPMYLGHMIFLGGLALLSRSPVAVGYLAYAVPWFDAHAEKDEERLKKHFGPEYSEYVQAVPRWLPGIDALKRLKPPKH